MTDTIESLRAERETALAEIAALRVQVRERDVALVEGVGGWLPKYRADKLAAERDAALAACAEMRAALERMIKYAVEDRATTPGSTRLERQITRANCLLARTDLGRGMVVVPREVLERLGDALTAAEDLMCAVPPRGHGCVCGCPVIDGHTSACVVMRAMRDLDALLKKGGG